MPAFDSERHESQRSRTGHRRLAYGLAAWLVSNLPGLLATWRKLLAITWHLLLYPCAENLGAPKKLGPLLNSKVALSRCIIKSVR